MTLAMRRWRPDALAAAVTAIAMVLMISYHFELPVHRQNSSAAGSVDPARSLLRANSFLLSNFRNREAASLLLQLHAFGYGSPGRPGGNGPFYFSKDGRASLPRRALHAITELPAGMVWIGDETIVVMIVSGQYSKVVTSTGILYGGWSKNCYFALALLGWQVKCDKLDLLSGAAFGFPFVVEAVGVANLPAFLRANRIDAIIAGPRTYHQTKQLFLYSPSVQSCLDSQIDIDFVLVLTNKRCLREADRPTGDHLPR